MLWGAATVAFFAQLALPGDRATAILNIRSGQAQLRTPAELAQINEQYGLQRPVIVQYLDYLRGLVGGDFGNSYQQYRPVTAIIGEQLGATVTLSLTAIVFAWILMVVWVTLTAGRGPRVARARRAWWMSWPPGCPPTGWASSCCWSSGSACAGSRSSAAPASTDSSCPR